MAREQIFTFRVDTTERQLLSFLAQRFERTQSDVVRLLIRDKARELGLHVRGGKAESERTQHERPLSGTD